MEVGGLVPVVMNPALYGGFVPERVTERSREPLETETFAGLNLLFTYVPGPGLFVAISHCDVSRLVPLNSSSNDR